jgi:glutathione peroxidase
MPRLTRRDVFILAGSTVLMAANKSDKLAWAFDFPSIDGGRLDFAALQGRVLLVTNTASFCGYTYQYEGLEKLHAAKSAAGLTVVGVPSQDFNQESADDATVKTFCETRFGIDFPLAALSHVRGAEAAPFYAWVAAQRNWQPAWNFNKVLIGRNGRIAGTFGATDEPDGPALSAAIDVELGRPV